MSPSIEPFNEIKYNNLIDGLEISEVKLSEVINESCSLRIDSNYFSKEFVKDSKLTNKCVELGNIAIIRSGTTPVDRDDNLKSGVILLKTNNIRNNILTKNDDSNFYYIDEKTNEKMRNTQIEPNDILINIVGATTDVVGRLAMVPDGFPKANITQAMSLCRIISNEFLPAYIFVFLNSKYGNKQVRRISRPTGQYNINLSELGAFKIIHLSKNFQEFIKKYFDIANEKINESSILLKDAENIFEKELNVSGIVLKDDNISIKKLSSTYNVFPRLDSEYYQQKYDEIEKIIKNYTNGFFLIKDKFEQNKKIYKPFAEKSNYIEIGDIDISNGSINYETIDTCNLPLNAKIMLEKHDILISKVRPYRGAIGINNLDVPLVASDAFVVLKEKDKFSVECLSIILRSKIYKEYIMKYNVGSSYPVIKNEDVLNLIIPNIPQDIQYKITEKIKLSDKLLDNSKDILDNLKKCVEMAIEHCEEYAINWLNGKIEL